MTWLSTINFKPKKHLNGQQKIQTHFDYTGNAGGYIKGDMGQDNFMNAETNPTKELFHKVEHQHLIMLKL